MTTVAATGVAAGAGGMEWGGIKAPGGIVLCLCAMSGGGGPLGGLGL